MERYTIVNFNSKSVLNMHLELVGVKKTEANRYILINFGKELRLLLGKENIKHLELQAYINRIENYIQLS